MARKTKEPKEVTLTTVLIVGFLSIGLGVMLALVSLATQSVVEVSRLPDVDKKIAGAVYFVKGSETGATNWDAKWRALQKGNARAIRITESDLNAWSRRNVSFEKPDKNGLFTCIPGKVNFHLTQEGLLQVAVPLEAPGISPGKQYLMQMRGTLSAQGGRVAFSPQEGFLGGAPIGYVPIVRGIISSYITGLFDGSDGAIGLSEAPEIQSVEIENGQIVVRFQS